MPSIRSAAIFFRLQTPGVSPYTDHRWSKCCYLRFFGKPIREMSSRLGVDLRLVPFLQNSEIVSAFRLPYFVVKDSVGHPIDLTSPAIEFVFGKRPGPCAVKFSSITVEKVRSRQPVGCTTG